MVVSAAEKDGGGLTLATDTDPSSQSRHSSAAMRGLEPPV